MKIDRSARSGEMSKLQSRLDFPFLNANVETFLRPAFIKKIDSTRTNVAVSQHTTSRSLLILSAKYSSTLDCGFHIAALILHNSNPPARLQTPHPTSGLEVLVSDSLTFVMSLQTRHIRRGVFSSR